MLWSAEVKRAINVNGTTTNQKIINIKDNKRCSKHCYSKHKT